MKYVITNWRSTLLSVAHYIYIQTYIHPHKISAGLNKKEVFEIRILTPLLVKILLGIFYVCTLCFSAICNTLLSLTTRRKWTNSCQCATIHTKHVPDLTRSPSARSGTNSGWVDGDAWRSKAGSHNLIRLRVNFSEPRLPEDIWEDAQACFYLRRPRYSATRKTRWNRLSGKFW